MKPSSAMPAYQEIIDALRSAVSDTGLITDPADVSAAALDGRGRRQGEALAVVRPASTEEVSLVMKTAAAIPAMSEAPRLNPVPPQRQHDELSSFSSAT